MSSFSPVDPAMIDHVMPEHDGYPAHLAAEDTRDALMQACGDAARDFPKELWIEPGPDFKNWKEVAAENDRNRTWGVNYVDRFTNQNPTHECTCHSLRTNAEGARNRQRAIIFPDGPKKDFRYEESAKYGSVWFSVLSVYPIANPAQWGGANVRQVLGIACESGFLPDKIQPRDYGFRHYLQGTAGQGNSNQSSGPWVTERQFPEGWKETAKLFKPQEVIFPESWEQAMCLLLHGRIVSVGRDGHAVPWNAINFANNVIPYSDSYNVTRYDSFSRARSAWQGSFSIATMTAPDDWNNPAAG